MKSKVEHFNIIDAILDIRDGRKDSFERDLSKAEAHRRGEVYDSDKVYVPVEKLYSKGATGGVVQFRDVYAGTTSAGGYLVGTENVGFIDMLRTRTCILRMGAQHITGLKNNAAFPRQTASSTAYWLPTEASTITETQQTFDQVLLTPKTVGAYTEISRQLLLQSSPAAQAVVTYDLAQVIGRALDLAAINGSGASGQPRGILNATGVPTLSGSSINYTGILGFQTTVASNNGSLVKPGYVTTPTVAGLLCTRVKFASTYSPLWEGALGDGIVAGYPAMSTNQIPAGDIIYGDFDQVMIGDWGGLTIDVNPYAGFTTALIGIRCLYTVDVGIRQPLAFCIATSVT